VGVIAVGLGNVAAARKFADLLQFPLDLLYAGEALHTVYWWLAGEVCANSLLC